MAAFGSKARLDSSLRLPDTSGVDSVPSSSLALKRPKFVTPPEAIGIAAAYRRLAEVAHRLADQEYRIARRLDASWEGNAKNRYDLDYGHLPSYLGTLAESLLHDAGQIERIMVTVYVRI